MYIETLQKVNLCINVPIKIPTNYTKTCYISLKEHHHTNIITKTSHKLQKLKEAGK